MADHKLVLKASDFGYNDEEWKGKPSGLIEFDDRSVQLQIGAEGTPSQEILDICRNSLVAWKTNKALIAHQTQEFLQDILPGRQIAAEELLLDVVILIFDQSPTPKPSLVYYAYYVDGDYFDEDYDLDRFDDSAIMTLDVKLSAGQPDFSEMSFYIENDY